MNSRMPTSHCFASFSSLLVPRCGSGRFLCSVAGSAAWLPYSPVTRWSPAVSMVSSATPAIWGCSSIRWWGLAFRSGVGVLLAALLIPPLLARIRAEETLLRTQFGAEYDAYCTRTSRLIPWIY